MKRILSFFLFSIMLTFNSRAQWTQTNGPEGGRITTMVSNGTTILAGADESGIFKSIDNATTWTPATTGIPFSTRISDLASLGISFYAATDNGVYKTSNGGVSWTQMNNGLTNFDARAIVVEGNSIFVGTNGGIFLSTDYGNSWTPVNSGLVTLHIYSLAVMGTKIIAGTDSAVFISVNNGAIWSRSSAGMHPQTQIRELSVGGGRIYAGSFNAAGLFASTDSGSTWVYQSGIPSGYISALETKGTNVYVGTTDGLFFSATSGSSWSRIDSNWVCTFVQSLLAGPSQIIVGTEGGGIYKSSNNGVTWTQSNHGMNATYVQTMEVRGSEIFAGTYGAGIISTADDGNLWTPLNSGLMGPVTDIDFMDSVIVASSTGYAIAGTGEGFYTSSNHGTTWAMPDNIPRLIPMSILCDGSDLFVGSQDGVYLSVDTANTWIQMSNQLMDSDVMVVKKIFGKLFAGVYDRGIFVSTDNGLTWDSSNTGMTNRYVNTFLSDGVNIFAGTYDGVYLSVDSGNTWTHANTGMGTQHVTSLVFYNFNIVAGTTQGVFFSANNGNSWSPSNIGLTNQYVFSLAVVNNKLFAGTNGDGVFVTSSLQTSLNENDKDNNFNPEIIPNPARDFVSVVLHQNIKHGEVEVFNLLGERIYSESFTSNKHSFSVEQFSAGIYIVKIKCDDKEMCKKLVVNSK